ncbi:hypothetical protein OIU78_003266 [Salix suchowensis]|nr:hypothetical protein OIU78_003266 [Salix suchowensis]
MSNSELFVVKENNEEKELDFLNKRSMLEFQKESHATTPQVSDPPQQLQEQEAKIEVHDESQEECNNVLDSNSMEKAVFIRSSTDGNSCCRRRRRRRIQNSNIFGSQNFYHKMPPCTKKTQAIPIKEKKRIATSGTYKSTA